jgi:hypothetical protein
MPGVKQYTRYRDQLYIDTSPGAFAPLRFTPGNSTLVPVRSHGHSTVWLAFLSGRQREETKMASRLALTLIMNSGDRAFSGLMYLSTLDSNRRTGIKPCLTTCVRAMPAGSLLCAGACTATQCLKGTVLRSSRLAVISEKDKVDSANHR